MTEPNIRTIDLCHMTRLSARQLQWWDEQGIIEPRHSGHRRQYGLLQAALVMILAKLRKKGMSLQRASALVPSLNKKLIGQFGLVHIATDGAKFVSVASSPSALFEDAAHVNGPVYILSVDMDAPARWPK